VNRRATTWLLAALLAFSAGAAVPAARAQSFGSGSTIVWVAQDRAEQRVVVQRPRPTRVPKAAVPRRDDPLARVQLFATFLYQRPPPFSLR